MQVCVYRNVITTFLVCGMMVFSGCSSINSELLYSENFSGKYIAFLTSNELAVCSERPDGEKEYLVLDVSKKEYTVVDETRKGDVAREFIHLFFDEKYKLRSPKNADFVGLYNNDPEHYIPPDGPLVKYPITFQGRGIFAWNFQECEKIYRKGKFFPLLLIYTPINNNGFLVRDVESGNLVKTGNYPYGSYHDVFMNESLDALVVNIVGGRSFFSPWEFYMRSERGKWVKKRRLPELNKSVDLFCSYPKIRFLAPMICAFVPSSLGRNTLVASRFGDRVELILYDFECDKFASIPVTGWVEVFRKNYTDAAYVSVSPCKNYVAYIVRPRSRSRELRICRIEWLNDLPKNSLVRNQDPDL